MKVRWTQQAFDGLEDAVPLPHVRKGNDFAGRVADYLGTERRVLNGAKDQGDLVSRTWVHEVKCSGRGKPLNLSAAMTEAKVEAKHAGVKNYSVIARRTGYPVAEALFVIPLWKAVELGLDPAWDHGYG